MKKIKDFLNEYRILLIFIICIFSFSPLVTNFFVSKDFGFVGYKSDWIVFSGGLLGSSLMILGVFVQLDHSRKEKLKVEEKEKVITRNRELKWQIEQIDGFLFNEYILKTYNVNIHYHHIKNNILSDSRFEILEDPVEKTENFISLEYGDSYMDKKYCVALEECGYFSMLINLKKILHGNKLKKNMVFKEWKLSTFSSQLRIMLILMFKLLENATDEELLYIKTTLMKYGKPIDLLRELSLIDDDLFAQYQKLKFFPTKFLFNIDTNKNISKKLKERVIKELNNLNIKIVIQDIIKIDYDISGDIPVIVLETKDATYKRTPKKVDDSYELEHHTWIKKTKHES